jgi:hypothetical protein
MPPPPTPDYPDPLDLSRGDDGEPLGGDAKWTTYKGAHRPCDRCVRAISQGVMKSHPQPGRLKRTGPTSEPEILCHQHGERQQTRDARVKRHLEGVRASTSKTRRR